MAESNLVHEVSQQILLPSKLTRQANPNDDFRVGVIAATKFDTLLGVDLLSKAGIVGIPYSTSDNPNEQTRLQLDKEKANRIVEYAIEAFLQESVHCIFIYCNSLSSVLDLIALRKKYTLPIITPLEAYQKYAMMFDKHLVMAANCQSVANLERILLTYNEHCTVTGIGNLALVNLVEAGLRPTAIIRNYRLIEQCQLFEKQGCQSIILGCTHFTYFKPELVKQLRKIGSKLTVIEPTTAMLEKLIGLLKVNLLTHS